MEQKTFNNLDDFKQFASEQIEEWNSKHDNNAILKYSILELEPRPDEYPVSVGLYLSKEWLFANDDFFDYFKKTLNAIYWTLEFPHDNILVHFLTAIKKEEETNQAQTIGKAYG